MNVVASAYRHHLCDVNVLRSEPTFFFSPLWHMTHHMTNLVTHHVTNPVTYHMTSHVTYSPS